MTLLRSMFRGFTVVAVVTLAAACSSSKSSGPTGGTGGTSDTGEFLDYCQLPQSCKDIAQACMPKDDGSKGTVHDCHLLGHETGDKTMCDAQHDKCVQTCTAAPPLSPDPPEDLSAPCRADASTSSS